MFVGNGPPLDKNYFEGFSFKRGGKKILDEKFNVDMSMVRQ